MKNPLVLFTGAALATLAALAGLNLTVWRGDLSDSQKPAEAASQAGDPATPSVEQTPSADAIGKTVESGTPENPADEAGKAPEQPTELAAIPAPEPPKAETGKPELDTVRVESDGQAIVAGRAEPGAEVSLKLGDQVIGKGLVNADGSWVVVPDQPLPKGPNEITVEQKMGDTPPVTAAQSIAVAIAEKPGQQAMVALTEPGTATKVLQAGGSQEQASLATTLQPEAQPAAPETTQPQASDTATKPAEAAPTETTVAKVEVPDAVAPPAETTPSAESAPAKATDNVALDLEAVDYNDKGDIIFSGRAKPGTAARLYVDNRAVGDAIVDSAGNWTFAGKNIIEPGTHDLRIDQIDKTGTVIARVELPFVRENAEAVAALNAPPARPAEESSAQPEAEPPAQPAAEAPAQKSAELPEPATVEPPGQHAAQQPQTTTTAPEQTAAEPQVERTAEQQPQASAPEPEKTAEQPPQVSAPETPKIAEAEPSQASEVQKTEPVAPAPEQAGGRKKEEATTTTAALEAAKAVNPDTPRLGKVVIQPGNNLWKLSRVIYGRGKNYTVIYQANKDQIRNPRRIYPGQILAIPGALPPEKIDPKRKEPLTSAEGGVAPQ